MKIVNFMSAITLIAMSYATCGEAYDLIQKEEESSLQMQRAHLLKTKQYISGFYADLKKRTPALNVEKEFNLSVSHDNAAEIMAFALLMRGDAPQTHSIFTEDYDPYKPCIYPNPYQQIRVITAVPETEVASAHFEKLNQGLGTHWPEFLQQIKTVNKARKQKQGQTSGQQAPNSSRKRLSHCFVDEFFNAPEQTEPIDVKTLPVVDKKRKFAEHLLKPEEKTWVSRKKK